ncbi:putative Serine/threonine-protein kinase Nek9 [Drepanopeziza brunnea f. sp. 'multigermtubi' MB_m1]|uniref:Putative Serine/threonine-protein kinase Nek9 n=1 Tax=Marssonina brunnea f. sp. multigermtubi (strain MB_m1) TaxID=1072389 RepID=K1WVH0_MARBU|nr:putative Serine/threonine-protein kinase Nek9 [Drepanopeziza brunnea f. sp. 'multigermtubi' MB_m1]EKD17041.1 putative Serine/threonine-protein kinase Nek9 [Drepanopeziza brunnea f. sp. 'multigermtubi' MB_m1]
MELWASGLNAWGQLDFSDRNGGDEFAKDDLKSFKCILEDHSIQILRTSISATLVSTHAGLRTAGTPDKFIQLCQRSDGLPNTAIAGNDQRAEFTPGGKDTHILTQYKSFDDAAQTLGEYEEMEDIVANQTTFTALAKSGRIYTWGDARYPNCLGRDIGENPAGEPSIVEDLAEVAASGIKKISSGGYVTAALTRDNDVYVWGGRAGQKPLIDGLEGSPTPIDLDGEDFLDIAVGMNHMLVLTTGRKLLVVGLGENGQLGLDVKEVENWTKVDLALKEGQQIVSIHAGYKNSFLLVDAVL